MMEIRLKLTFLENLFLCLCLLTGLGQANGATVVRVREGSEAVLPCFIKPEQNIERDAFEWRKVGQMVFLYKNSLHSNNGLPGQDEQFKGRVSHFPDQLQFGDASIRIRDTKESDSGTYTCDFSPDDFNRQIFNIELAVCSIIRDRSEENIGGASPQPRITSLSQSRYEAKLQCEVRRVSPKPKVEWQDSSGNILPAEEPQVTERGGSYDIILQTTVTKTDDYRCVVTQEEICHQVSAVTSVFIHGPPIGWIVGGVVAAVLLLIVLLLLAWLLYKYYKKCEVSELFVTTFKTKDGMLLQCVVRGASPKPEVKWQDSSGNILPAEEPEVTEKGGKYFIILNRTVTETGRYQCVVKQEGINHQVSEEISVKIPVFTDPEPPEGETLKLSVRTIKTDDGARLRCDVRGVSPKPELEWQDSSGNILPAEELQVTERGGIYDIILQTTVTKTGNYRCVAKQEGIEDQTKAEIYVFIPGFSTGWIVAGVLCPLLFVGILLAVLYKKGLIKRKKDSQTETNGDENSPESVELNRNHDTSAV